MYIPAHFAQTDPARVFALVRRHPLATLVTGEAGGFGANHLPFHLDVDDDGRATLLAHIPRTNPLSQSAAGSHALAIFHGPNAYISPNWYPTKRETGRVVPTWNYDVVHAHGNIRVVDDADWVRLQLTALTAAQEARFPAPWRITDAPPDFTDAMIRMLVGIEFTVTCWEAKTKASQNQPAANRDAVAAALAASDDSRERAMGETVRNAIE